MNTKQLKWAMQQPWFLRWRRNHLGTFTVLVNAWEGPRQFYDFNEMLAWAGM